MSRSTLENQNVIGYSNAILIANTLRVTDPRSAKLGHYQAGDTNCAMNLKQEMS